MACAMRGVVLAQHMRRAAAARLSMLAGRPRSGASPHRFVSRTWCAGVQTQDGIVSAAPASAPGVHENGWVGGERVPKVLGLHAGKGSPQHVVWL